MRKYPPLRKLCSLLDKRVWEGGSFRRKGQSTVVFWEGRWWCKQGVVCRLWSKGEVVCKMGYNCGVVCRLGCKCGVVVYSSNEVLCIHIHR